MSLGPDFVNTTGGVMESISFFLVRTEWPETVWYVCGQDCTVHLRRNLLDWDGGSCLKFQGQHARSDWGQRWFK